MSDRSPIFLVRPDAELLQLKPSAPATEDELQLLIARHPALIGDNDGDLLLIDREHGIPDALDGASRWSIDHVYVTRQARPVFVEVKRAVDTRLRREVVGQMLDYAANGVAYWPTGALAARFEQACLSRQADPAEELAQFLEADTTPTEFWSQVEANLRSGLIKLVFVADAIPAELARIVEFLNDQMTADVRAVELNYYESPDGSRMLAPRIIGETERTRAQKGGSRPPLEPISVDDWLEQRMGPRGPSSMAGAHAVVKFLAEAACEIVMPPSQGWIYFRVLGPTGKVSYPFYLTASANIQIGFGSLGGAPSLTDEEERRRFYEQFSDAVGPLSTRNLKGFPAFPVDRLNAPAVLAQFEAVARDYLNACRT